MPDAALIVVRVTPRSARDEVVGYEGGVLRVRLRAPPVEGKANDALVALLAPRLGIAQRDVEIVAGATGRVKQIRVHGLSLEAALLKLTEA